MTSSSDTLSRSGLIPGGGTEQTFFAHSYPASEMSVLAFTANSSVMTAQWSLNRIDVDYEDVVNLSAGVGVSVRFPTRSEYVALKFVGTGGTDIRYQTGFRTAGASMSVLASLGTGAEVLKADVPGIRSILSSDASVVVTELAEEIDITGAGNSVTLASAGGTETLVQDGVGPDLFNKGLTAGSNISLVGGANDVTIAFAGVDSPYQQAATLISPVSSPVSAIASGVSNTITSTNSFIGGGDTNAISGGTAQRTAIIGGDTNTIQGSRNGVIVGGESNVLDPSGNAADSVIAGGDTNTITGQTDMSVILSGRDNIIDTNSYGITVGGDDNMITQTLPTRNSSVSFCYGLEHVIDSANTGGIMGGQQNTLRSVTDPCRRSVIIGGRVNRIEDAKDGAIVGSDTCVVDIATGNHCGIYTSVDSTISGSNADGMTIIGGNGASITEAPYSLIGGTDTACTHGGCFMYSDSAGGTALSSSATHEFSVRCSGGARFFSNTANTLGVSLAAGGAAWAAISDRNMKDLHGEVNQTQILSQVRQLPIHRYNYKGQDEDMIYIGPMAQDWHRLFPSGKDPLKIDTTDPVGVALACCQALDARIDDEAESADREMIRLERKIDELSSRLDVFEALTSRG